MSLFMQTVSPSTVLCAVLPDLSVVLENVGEGGSSDTEPSVTLPSLRTELGVVGSLRHQSGESS